MGAATSGSTTQQQQYDYWRAGGHAESRLYTVSPTEGERFCSQLLLLHMNLGTVFA